VTAAARRRAPDRPYDQVPWSLFLWPPLVLSALLLLLPQASFLWMSLHRTTGVGEIARGLTIDTYRRILADGFYRDALWLTFRVALTATAIDLLVGFPCAYYLARLRSRRAPLLIALLLISSFVTVVIKALGLTLLLGREGIVNHALQAAGLISAPLPLLNNATGVVIGLVQYTMPIVIIMLFGVVQTIPASLEHAAEILGATWLSALRRVVLPIARPGLLAAGLIAFNLNMGAFTSAILLGGGRVLTLPVLIQRKIALDVDYSTGAALSTLLLVIVFALNLAAAALFARGGRRRRRAGPGLATEPAPRSAAGPA
jgi:putative spermidine/putrescine transport system permease protein